MPNCLVQDRISRCTSAFSTGEERKFNPRGSNFPSTGPLHQFARDVVYLTNDQILYAKKSTRDVLSLSLSLPSIRALLRLESVRDTFPPSRIHLYTTTCSLRVISHPAGYYNGARNGNRQMIHEDVKRDVSRQRFAFSKPRPNTIVVKKRFPMLGEDEGDVSEVIAPRQVFRC